MESGRVSLPEGEVHVFDDGMHYEQTTCRGRTKPPYKVVGAAERRAGNPAHFWEGLNTRIHFCQSVKYSITALELQRPEKHAGWSYSPAFFCLR